MMNIDNYGLRLYGANLDELIKMALREDIGDGDHSTLACIPPDSSPAAEPKSDSVNPSLSRSDEASLFFFSLSAPEPLRPTAAFSSALSQGKSRAS